MLTEHFWEIRVQFASGNKILLCGTAPTGEDAIMEAVDICVKEWSQNADTLAIVGMKRGKEVNFRYKKRKPA